MTSPNASAHPTWYDVLGVPRDATPEEIKAAWRNATDKFEPGSGSGQFRMFNEAADVLLDPARRESYDASLDAPAPARERADADPVPAPPSPEPLTGDSPAEARPSRRPWRLRRTAEPATAGAVTSKVAASPAGDTSEPASRRAGVVAAVLALLTVAALAAAGYFALEVREDARAADARDEAPAAAEGAAKAILSYDYRRLPTDRKRAEDFLTADYQKEYEKTFKLLEEQEDGTPGAAVQTKTVVTASVLGSGVMDADGDTARVLVFVNQVSKRPGRDPQIFQNRVAMTMKQTGDRWLVDNLKSY